MNGESCRDDVVKLWQAHRQAELPDVPHRAKGELLVLDEVIGGGVAFYLGAGSLDQPRRAILEDCRADLDRLIPALEAAAAVYFIRLGKLADLLLAASPPAGDPGT